MRSLLHHCARPPAAARQRLILLPGAYHRPEDLIAQGFAEHATRRGLPVDIEFVDIDMAHLDDRRALTELHERIVVPARSAGCTRIWLAGISLGGFIALAYAAARPRTIDGLCLLAPYLGNRMLLKEIAAAPGIAAWQPGELAQEDEERRIWRFLQGSGTASSAAPAGAAAPPIFLGFGRNDRFVQGHELLAAALPPGSVSAIAGGHEWQVWRELWETFLDVTFHDAGSHDAR